MNKKQFYNVREVSEILGTSISFVYKRLIDEDIPHKRIGTRYLIPRKYIFELENTKNEKEEKVENTEN